MFQQLFMKEVSILYFQKSTDNGFIFPKKSNFEGKKHQI